MSRVALAPTSMPISFFELQTACLADFSSSPLPSVLSAWKSAALRLENDGTHFGFVVEGPSLLSSSTGRFELKTGMYFSVPAEMTISGGAGIVVSRRCDKGLFSLGGPIEEVGRLRYIDGCTDTLLIGPPLCGDPCLNLLHIPPKTAQSAHTHTSLRAGVVARGRGRCVTPDSEVMLETGTAFTIPADCVHCFHTDDEELLVIAYHPDTDCGPTHEDHPMRNRTHLCAAPSTDVPKGVR